MMICNNHECGNQLYAFEEEGKICLPCRMKEKLEQNG